MANRYCWSHEKIPWFIVFQWIWLSQKKLFFFHSWIKAHSFVCLLPSSLFCLCLSPQGSVTTERFSNDLRVRGRKSSIRMHMVTVTHTQAHILILVSSGIIGREFPEHTESQHRATIKARSCVCAATLSELVSSVCVCVCVCVNVCVWERERESSWGRIDLIGVFWGWSAADSLSDGWKVSILCVCMHVCVCWAGRCVCDM